MQSTNATVKLQWAVEYVKASKIDNRRRHSPPRIPKSSAIVSRLKYLKRRVSTPGIRRRWRRSRSAMRVNVKNRKVRALPATKRALCAAPTSTAERGVRRRSAKNDGGKKGEWRRKGGGGVDKQEINVISASVMRYGR